VTLLFIDGFDHENFGHSGSNTEIWQKGWNGDNFGSVAGRVSIPGYVNVAVEVINNNALFRAIPVVDEFVVGVAFNLGNGGGNLISVNPRSGNGISWGVNDVGVLYITCGSTTVYGTTPTYRDSWNYVEMKVAGGDAELHLNGNYLTPEIPATAMPYGTSFYKLYLTISGLGAGVAFDDFYLLDLSGPDNNDFLGDVHIDTLFPISDGHYHDWTPKTGVDHFAMVNEHIMDDDTTYNHDVTPGDKDSFQMQPLPFSVGTIFGAQLNLGTKKADAGLRQIKGLARVGGTDYLGPLETLNTSYEFWSWMMDVNPATSTQWTYGEINGDEFGIELYT
jgi:hypothetical protein